MMVKELDFDELDRAVSNLMGSVAKPDDANKKPVVATSPTTPLTSPPVPASAEPPTTVSKVPTTEPLASTMDRPSPRASVPVQRSSGRFMDVVHPSGDMKQARSLTPPSREGIAITPRPSVSTPAESSAESSPVISPATHDTMPDPISLAESLKPPVTPSLVPSSDVTMPTEEDDKKAPAMIADSPFLPDTKVEKRPLGNQPPTGGEDKDKSVLPLENVSANKDDGNPPAPLPAELANDLVTIESKELTAAHTPAVPELEKTTPPSGPASIIQQYKEQPSSGDDSHAAIYDAASVPQPLTHPTKKKSGWLWVVWVLLLLALGGGGAALLYATGIIP